MLPFGITEAMPNKNRKMNRCRHHRIILFTTVLLILFPLPAFAGKFKVVIVYDGDTIKAIGNGQEIKARLLGIDAPEIFKGKLKPGQPLSEKARKYLSGMVLNKRVNIDSYGLDVHERILAKVFVDGKNVNLEMINAGMAEVNRDRAPPGSDLALFRQAEKEARAAKRGIWAQGDDYISPKKWRKMYYGKTPLPDSVKKDKDRKKLLPKKTTVKRIHFEIGKESEKVMVHLGNYSPPEVFNLDGKNPRIVVDIGNVSSWGGKHRIPVDGRLIKRIRTYLHPKSEKLRIVIDLNFIPSEGSSIVKVYDASKNIYWIAIRK